MNKLGVVLLASIVALLIAGCSNAAPTFEPERQAPARAIPPASVDPPPATAPTAMPEPPATRVSPAPTANLGPTAGPSPIAWPAVYDYNLGNYTIIQQNYAADHPWHSLPLELMGTLALPEGEGPFPVVVVLHGRHDICDVDMSLFSADPWPCPEGTYIRNDRGMQYILEALAARGYLAMAIDLNVEHLDSYGEFPYASRAIELFEQHMRALQQANRGEQRFVVDLRNKVNLQQIMLIGHSRGADYGAEIARRHLKDNAADPGAGTGPIMALLQIAPALYEENFATLNMLDLPIAVLLPECDYDVSDLAGQTYYEVARYNPERRSVLALAYLQSANHNFFNDQLTEDVEEPGMRVECSPNQRLTREEQRRFMVAYAADFADYVLGRLDDPARAGLDPSIAVPHELYGVPVLTSLMMPADARRTLLIPESVEALDQNRLGGAISFDGPISTEYCPFDVPCNAQLRQPGIGTPEQFVVAWENRDGVPLMRFEIPPAYGDLRGFASLGFRAAVNPYSELNRDEGRQSLRLVLYDSKGRSASALVAPDEPAMAFPDVPRGNEITDDPEVATGFTALGAVRIPLAAFDAVDLSAITALELVFDQTPAGNLYLADLEFFADDSASQ